MSEQRWQQLMNSLGFTQSERVYQQLITYYAQKHRHYHTLEHIEDCLKHFDAVKSVSLEPLAIELAIWFHDAIYQPFSKKNEFDSAKWAKSFILSQSEKWQTLSEQVFNLILATAHASKVSDPDALLLLDIDLSILGSEQSTYQAYEGQIRQEYKKVPFFIYKRKRIKILQQFLNRKTIYTHGYFYEKYEHQARENLHRAISLLTEGG